jgi:hypothetical protein
MMEITSLVFFVAYLFSNSPNTFASDPTQAMIWGVRRAFGVRGKLHPASLWLDISYGKASGTLKA